MQNYPGNAGILLAAACLGVPFIAGAKLLDSVRPAETVGNTPTAVIRRTTPRRFSRNRPRVGRSARGSMLPLSHRTD
jgi:hypothetical protein